MRNYIKLLDVAPPRIQDMPFQTLLFAFFSIICFALFVVLLILAIKNWKSYKENNGTKKKFIVTISLSAVIFLLFVFLFILFWTELFY